MFEEGDKKAIQGMIAVQSLFVEIRPDMGSSGNLALEELSRLLKIRVAPDKPLCRSSFWQQGNEPNFHLLLCGAHLLLQTKFSIRVGVDEKPGVVVLHRV